MRITSAKIFFLLILFCISLKAKNISNFLDEFSQLNVEIEPCARIFNAIRQSDTSLVRRLLLYEGVSLNCEDYDGNNCLHKWAASEHLDFQIFLLLVPYTSDHSKQCDKGKQNLKGRTPLMLALATANQAKAYLLLAFDHGENTANINALDRAGLGALHLSVLEHHVPAAKLCLHYGADPNLAMRNGDTALHLAVRYQFFEMAQILLSHGADPQALNSAGQSSKDLARIFNHEAMFNLLNGEIIHAHH